MGTLDAVKANATKLRNRGEVLTVGIGGLFRGTLG